MLNRIQVRGHLLLKSLII